MKNIQEMERQWRQARPIMRNSGQELIALLRDEVTEAEAELENPDKLGAEIADIVLFACALANEYGIDLEMAVERKQIRNFLKYPASELQEGDYQEKRRVLRDSWNHIEDNLGMIKG